MRGVGLCLGRGVVGVGLPGRGGWVVAGFEWIAGAGWSARAEGWIHGELE